ncbi:MAG: DEAD/DEAH box helicase [Gammaproteobacteria bacterium]
MRASGFHPLTVEWFRNTIGAPYAVQEEAWRSIAGRQNSLVMAPTGSGKTLAAFLVALDRLLQQTIAGNLEDQCQVLYVSPLRALAADIRQNLEMPCTGLAEAAHRRGYPDFRVRLALRTGDTPSAERRRMMRKPPHFLLTTPESLFLLLSNPSGRTLLKTVRTVILDEVHAWIETKRGAHLLLSIERLAHLTERPLQRIGLSATVRPPSLVAQALAGSGAPLEIVDGGGSRHLDFALEVPTPLTQAVLSQEQWGVLYDRIVELVQGCRTVLVFTNTRRLAERTARQLADRLGEDRVGCHHGSLAREMRLEVESRLRSGQLQVLVATASLELGIDLGTIDLVCQIGSPKRIHTLIQRVGRSGHHLGATPRGRLFPLSRQDLAEGVALARALERGVLEQLQVASGSRDVLAQQIVAEVSVADSGDRMLFEMIRRAWPYRDWTWQDFESVLDLLCQGFTNRWGHRHNALLYWDRAGGRLNARPGARISAWLNAGTLPDQFDLEVRLMPADFRIGTLHEDFAFESSSGDVFQLGNASYRILRVKNSRVEVEEAPGATPTVPFWIGEAPGRSRELSEMLADLQGEAAQRLAAGEDLVGWLCGIPGVGESSTRLLARYWSDAMACFGALPGPDTLLIERFFDAVGDTHLVIHSPWGSRINRAWGWALRKRFCRQFNFELQAAALEDSLVLSLGPRHSFPLEAIRESLKPESARDLLVQALLATPLFATRWRWVAQTALAVPRRTARGPRPPPHQRAEAEDLLTMLFPDALACPENLAGSIPIPDHPLIDQTLEDCLNESLDAPGWVSLLERIGRGEIRWIVRDRHDPSPLAQEILAARPYAFLDPAPAEERRTRNVSPGPRLEVDDPILDEGSLARFAQALAPSIRTPDDLVIALSERGLVTEGEVREWSGPPGSDLTPFMDTLVAEGRAIRTQVSSSIFWVAADRFREFQMLFPDLQLGSDGLEAYSGRALPICADEARRELLRSYFEHAPPVSVDQLVERWGLPESEIAFTIGVLEGEGMLLAGALRSSPNTVPLWADRRLLARFMRERRGMRQSRSTAVPFAVWFRFLFAWQGVSQHPPKGDDTLITVLDRLEGWPMPAPALEREILPLRLPSFAPSELDDLMTQGGLNWMRHLGHARMGGLKPLKTAPLIWVPHEHLANWLRLERPVQDGDLSGLSDPARRIHDQLRREGASFQSDLESQNEILPAIADRALIELINHGLVSTDRYSSLRRLWSPRVMGSRLRVERTRRFSTQGGRWFVWPSTPDPVEEGVVRSDLEVFARVLLRRYGIVFPALIGREAGRVPWRELAHFYRRLEAREEIRGGRFIEGVSGEQFALAEAVGALERVAGEMPDGAWITVSATDVFNLSGIVLEGPRIASVSGNRLLWRSGELVAARIAGRIEFLREPSSGERWAWHQALLRVGLRPALAPVAETRSGS